MSASQEHGLEIERRIKKDMLQRSKGVFPAHLPVEPGHTAKFDVPGYVDPYGKGIPTSVKSAKARQLDALVYLADATRIADLRNHETTRLLVALYDQEGDRKVFREVREYLLTGAEWKKLMGNVPAGALEDFNQAIRVPSADRARRFARQWKASLAERYPAAKMRWNPKIDSKNQRRLQCSVYLRDVEAVIADKSRIRVFGAPKDPVGVVRPPYLTPVSRYLWGNGLRFPLSLASAPRVVASQATAPAPESSLPRRPRC